MEMPQGGGNKWLLIGLAVIVVLYFVMKGGSSSGATSGAATMDPNTAATEQARLGAAASAYGQYLQAQTAQLISNNNVTMNGQTVAGNVAQAASGSGAYKSIASTNANASNINALIGAVAGLTGQVLKGLNTNPGAANPYGGSIYGGAVGSGYNGPVYSGGGDYGGGYG